MVENWHRGLINCRQMNSRLLLLLPFFPGFPVVELINAEAAIGDRADFID